MYHSNPLFWIIALIALSPFILWWWNFLRRQLEALGLIRLMFEFRYYIRDRLRNRRTEYRITVTPNPRSGSPVNFWNDIIIWPIMMGPLIIFIAFSTTIPSFSLQWWAVIGWSIVILIGVFGMPIYVSALALWLKTNNTIKKATQRLRQVNISDNSKSVSYLEVFIGISDDLRMGLDPRILPIAYQSYRIDALSFLSELMSLGLVRPDKKTEPDTLAHRYYLTRSGSTLVKRIKNKR